MAITDDFSVTVGKDIRYTGAAHTITGAGYYTVIELHRWLQDIADDAEPATANDLVDITSETPSERSTDNIIKLINGYNIDQIVAEHLYDGSIIQGDAGVDQQIWDGLVVIAAADMDLQIMQDGVQYIDGSSDDFWNSIMFNDGGINPNGYKGLNFDTANGISHRFMVKVHDYVVDGGDIDGRRIIGMTRVDYSTKEAGDTYGKTFSEFKVNGTARGNNVLALTYADDLNDAESAAGFSTIDNTEGYRGIDVDANGADEYYYSEWDRDTYTINKFFQRIKYVTRGDAANVSTLYGVDAKIFRGITHEITVTSSANGGTWVEPESLSWTGGTGQLLAVDDTDDTASTKIWIMLLTGVVPSSGLISGATGEATVSGNTERTVSTPICGVSTGSALIGAYGFGLEALDLGPADTVFDLDGAPHNAPNNVTFTVGGAVTDEDRILVGPDGGGTTLGSTQFDTDGALAGGVSVTVEVGTGGLNETPGTGTQSESDTPNSGTIRIADDNDVYQRVIYTGYTVGAGTMTFTGCSDVPTTSGVTSVFISYIDALKTASTDTYTYTATYGGSARALFIRVRDGGTAGDAEGIKTYETSASLGDSSTSITVNRTPDA